VFLHLGRSGGFFEILRVDAYGKSSEGNLPIPIVDFADGPLGGNLDPVFHRPETGGEVPPIPNGLKTDKIVVHKGFEKRDPPGKAGEDVRRGKGNVQKKIGFPGISLLLESPGNPEKLIVMNPEIILLAGIDPCQGGKAAVYVAIPLPELRTEDAGGLEIVEEGPQKGVGKALVIPRHLLLGELEGHQAIAALPGYPGEKVLQGVPGDILFRAGPPYPVSSPIPKHGVESRHEPPRSWSRLPLILLPGEHHRKPIGYYHQLRIFALHTFMFRHI
jgi:hypothetical protein